MPKKMLSKQDSVDFSSENQAGSHCPTRAWKTAGAAALLVQHHQTNQKKKHRKSREFVVVNFNSSRVVVGQDDKVTIQNQVFDELSRTTPAELVGEGKLEDLKMLVQEFNVTLHARLSNGATLLHLAVEKNQLEVAEYLMDMAVDVNAVNSEGNTALHIAASTANTRAIKLLLTSPVINDGIVNALEMGPLHVAVATLNVDVVQAFVENDKVDLIVKGKHGRTPLHLVAELDFLEGMQVVHEIVKAQSEKKGMQHYKFRVCSQDNDGVTPIHYAARCGSARTLDFMITVCSSHGYPVEAVLKFLDEENSTPLHVAVGAGHVGVVEVLLKHGACPCSCNGDQVPSLHLAIARGNLPILELMVAKVGDGILQTRDKFNSTALHKAVFSINSEALVAYLLKHGMDPNAVDDHGASPMHVAAALGNESAVRMLLAQGGNPHIRNKMGQNVLCVAAQKKKGAVVRLVFEQRSCCDLLCQLDKFQKNAVHYIVSSDDNALLVSMLEITKFKGSTDGMGNSILHAVATRGSVSALNSVLGVSEALFYINDTNDLGLTPLHVAASAGKLKCAEILLQHGAVVHKCHIGGTPFHFAAKMGHLAMMKLLYEAHSFQKDWTTDSGDNVLHFAARANHPEVVLFALDIGVAIVHNNSQESFLDIAIQSQHPAVAKVAVSHDRWEECLDLSSPSFTYPMAALIEHMPDIAIMVLDKCRFASNHNSDSREYCIDYNFKYVLNPAEAKGLHVSGSSDNNFEDVDADMTFSAISETFHYDKRKSEADVNSPTSLPSHPHLHILRTMCKHKRQQLISHPVVETYLRTKWKYYGRLVNIATLLLFLLYLGLLSSLVPILMPVRSTVSTGDNVSISDTTPESLNGTNSSGIEEDTGTIYEYQKFIIVPLTIIFCLLNCFQWILNRICIYRQQAFTLSWDIIVETLAYTCTMVFLVLLCFSITVWEVGAFGLCFSWLSLIFRLQFYQLFGIYIFMIIEIFNTLLRVMLVALLFIIGFGLVMYVIAGDITEYSSPFRAMFLSFAAALGEFEYSTFPQHDAEGGLRYPALAYVFVIILSLMLAISVSNLLIGLAVGDIENCRKNAVFSRSQSEVQYYSGLDPFLMLVRCLRSYLVIHRRRNRPNARRNIIRRIWRRIWHLIHITDGSINHESRDTASSDSIEALNKEVSLLKAQIGELISLQNEQTKLMRGFARRVPRSSTILDSDTFSDVSFDSTSFDSR